MRGAIHGLLLLWCVVGAHASLAEAHEDDVRLLIECDGGRVAVARGLQPPRNVPAAQQRARLTLAGGEGDGALPREAAARCVRDDGECAWAGPLVRRLCRFDAARTSDALRSPLFLVYLRATLAFVMDAPAASAESVSADATAAAPAPSAAPTAEAAVGELARALNVSDADGACFRHTALVALQHAQAAQAEVFAALPPQLRFRLLSLTMQEGSAREETNDALREAALFLLGSRLPSNLRRLFPVVDSQRRMLGCFAAGDASLDEAWPALRRWLPEEAWRACDDAQLRRIGERMRPSLRQATVGVLAL